jgi:hypothetical protein
MGRADLHCRSTVARVMFTAIAHLGYPLRPWPHWFWSTLPPYGTGLSPGRRG